VRLTLKSAAAGTAPPYGLRTLTLPPAPGAKLSLVFYGDCEAGRNPTGIIKGILPAHRVDAGSPDR
jgi:hypothetical protein